MKETTEIDLTEGSGDVTQLLSNRITNPLPQQHADAGITLESIPIKALVVPTYHPRIDLGDLSSLAESIRRDGLLDPPLVMQGNDGQYIIIDGVRRLEAAKKLGWEQILCKVSPAINDADAAHRSYIANTELKTLSPIEESSHIKRMRDEFGYSMRELEVMGYGTPASISQKLKLLTLVEPVQAQIRDGKITATHGYALAKLSIPGQQERMANQVIAHEMSTSKTKARVDALINKSQRAQVITPKDQIPAGEIPGIYLKDSRDMCELPNDSVHLIVTSPPYNINKDFEQNVPHAVHLDEVKSVCEEIARVTKPGGIIAINVDNIINFKGADGKNKESQVELMGHKYQQIFRKLNITLSDVIIWEKDTNWNSNFQVHFNEDTPHTSYRFLHNYDFVYVFRKKGARELPPEDVIQKSKLTKEQWIAWIPAVWKIKTVWKQEGHPTQYPDELCSRLIKMLSFEGDTVLDPWLGSGTTIKVARELNRNGIGYERELKYKAVIMKKLGLLPADIAEPISMAGFAAESLSEVEIVAQSETLHSGNVPTAEAVISINAAQEAGADQELAKAA